MRHARRGAAATTSLVAVLLAAALALAGCGGHGGAGGVDPGPAYWAIPFVSDSSQSTLVLLRNVDSDGAVATLQGYEPDGTPYTGPVAVSLDGFDEHALDVTDALGGDTPAGGWILVSTPSLRVEVAFDVDIPGKVASEAARAWPLPDLAVPPPTWFQGLTITSEASLLQIGNATAAPIVVSVTAYREPADPLAPPDASTPAPIALAPFESKTFSPSGLSGFGGFVGSFAFSSTAPFFAAVEEDLAFDGQPQVEIRARVLEAGLRWGQESFTPPTWTDFAVVVRNDADSARTVTLNRIDFDSGTPILLAPRTVGLGAHESRVVTSSQPPFDDLFGDPTAQPGLIKMSIEVAVPEDVALTFRQFDPVALDHNMTVVPHAVGHVFETLDVFPTPVLPSSTRTFAEVLNPNDGPIDVDVSSLIPQPDGFDAGPLFLTRITLAAHERADFSPDGVLYVDRDGIPTGLVGLRFASVRPFAVTGRREQRDGAGVLFTLSPMIVRNHEESE